MLEGCKKAYIGAMELAQYEGKLYKYAYNNTKRFELIATIMRQRYGPNVCIVEWGREIDQFAYYVYYFIEGENDAQSTDSTGTVRDPIHNT